jgi:serine/threonine-protein kinase
MLSATKTQQNSKGWACQRALTAVNNVVIDTDACSYNLTDQRTTIARQIAAKVPTT